MVATFISHQLPNRSISSTFLKVSVRAQTFFLSTSMQCRTGLGLSSSDFSQALPRPLRTSSPNGARRRRVAFLLGVNLTQISSVLPPSHPAPRHCLTCQKSRFICDYLQLISKSQSQDCSQDSTQLLWSSVFLQGLVSAR